MSSQLDSLSQPSYLLQTSGIVPLCRFNDCENRALPDMDKCRFHRNRRQCEIEGCTNQVYARKLCVRHGGKRQCQVPECNQHARGGGFCLSHGGFAVKRFCRMSGCSKQAHAKQLCVRHGGGRKCKVVNCNHHARAGGYCNKHGEGLRCSFKDCNKIVRTNSSTCSRHDSHNGSLVISRKEEVFKKPIARGSKKQKIASNHLVNPMNAKEPIKFCHGQLMYSGSLIDPNCIPIADVAVGGYDMNHQSHHENNNLEFQNMISGLHHPAQSQAVHALRDYTRRWNPNSYEPLGDINPHDKPIDFNSNNFYAGLSGVAFSDGKLIDNIEYQILGNPGFAQSHPHFPESTLKNDCNRHMPAEANKLHGMPPHHLFFDRRFNNSREGTDSNSNGTAITQQYK